MATRMEEDKLVRMKPTDRTGFGSWKNMNWKIPYKKQKFLEKYIMRDFVKLLARLYAK